MLSPLTNFFQPHASTNSASSLNTSAVCKLVRGLIPQGCIRTCLEEAMLSPNHIASHATIKNILQIVKNLICIDQIQGSANMLDKYLIFIKLLLNQSPLLMKYDARMFTIRNVHNITTSTLIDIGSEIRELLFTQSTNNTFVRILEFSLPFGKHNRLHFPNQREFTKKNLQEIVRLMLASCLGLYETAARRPVWQWRLKILIFFWDFLHVANIDDLYSFCRQYILLLKLSVMEYFFYFLYTNMPLEYEYMMKNGNGKSDKIITSFCFHFDQFRHMCYAKKSEIDFEDMNEFAAQIIEKCSRLWKGKIEKTSSRQSLLCSRGISQKSAYNESLSILDFDDNILFQRALQLPRLNHASYYLLFKNTSIQMARQIQDIQDSIQIYPLPSNLQQQQFAFARQNILRKGRQVINTFSVFVCFKCLILKPKQSMQIDRKMRSDSQGNFYCSLCNCNEFVVEINTLGRLVKLTQNYYFYCIHCQEIHSTNNLSNFTSCPQYKAPSSYQKNKPVICGSMCCLCDKKSNTQQLSVLDDKLGIQTNLYFCSWHYPFENMHSCIYNYESLLEFIEIKHRQLKKKSVY